MGNRELNAHGCVLRRVQVVENACAVTRESCVNISRVGTRFFAVSMLSESRFSTMLVLTPTSAWSYDASGVVSCHVAEWASTVCYIGSNETGPNTPQLHFVSMHH